MFASFKGVKQVYQSTPKVGLFAFVKNSSCRNFNRLRGNFYAKWETCGISSILSPRKFRNLERFNCIETIPVEAPWIWPLFSIHSTSGYYQSLVTRASPSEEEMTDEIINKIVSAIKNDPMFSKDICSTYIDKFCKARNLFAASQLLRALRQYHIFLSAHTYNLLMEAAGAENDIDLLSQAFKDLLTSGECMSMTSFLKLAKGFTKITDNVSLIKFVRGVSELAFTRSTTVINQIIFAFAECGQIDKAFLIFDQMKSFECKPDLVTYNTLLGILGRTGQVDEMVSKFVSMKEANITPDIVSYNTLINSLRKVNKLDMCLLYLKEMVEQEIQPDLRTYTALIESYGRTGNVEESLKLFKQMKSKRIRPSIYIYRSLINNLKKMGKLELAGMLYDEMNKCLSGLVASKDFKRRHR